MERRGPEERPSITLWPPGPLAATPLKHSPNKAGMETEARHAQVGVRAARRRREETGMERERKSKRASLVDLMSLEPGVTAPSPPATGREK